MEETKIEEQKQEPDKIERAEAAVKRMEEAEKRLDEKISKLQELEVNRLLGSTAGIRTEPQAVKEDTAKEYAEKVLAGKILPR